MTPNKQYQQTFVTYFERFLDAKPEYDSPAQAANAVVEDFADELRDTNQDSFLLAFGFCLFSEHGPTRYWTKLTDSEQPEDVAIALAQSALVNDILKEA